MSQSNPTSFQQVSNMNTAFGNPQGDYNNINKLRLLRQVSNIFDEYVELLTAFGVDTKLFHALKIEHSIALTAMRDAVEMDLVVEGNPFNTLGLRDALCDVQVFALGGQHFMGVNGDADMKAVVDGVMTRFIKDEADKQATIAKHAANGITDVYFEGSFPTMVMKSASDQPDAPKGKFLKSASYKDTVFPDVVDNIIECGLPTSVAALGGIPAGQLAVLVGNNPNINNTVPA